MLGQSKSRSPKRSPISFPCSWSVAQSSVYTSSVLPAPFRNQVIRAVVWPRRFRRVAVEGLRRRRSASVPACSSSTHGILWPLWWGVQSLIVVEWMYLIHNFICLLNFIVVLLFVYILPFFAFFFACLFVICLLFVFIYLLFACSPCLCLTLQSLCRPWLRVLGRWAQVLSLCIRGLRFPLQHHATGIGEKEVERFSWVFFIIWEVGTVFLSF
jgi:hypothetical protein